MDNRAYFDATHDDGERLRSLNADGTAELRQLRAMRDVMLRDGFVWDGKEWCVPKSQMLPFGDAVRAIHKAITIPPNTVQG